MILVVGYFNMLLFFVHCRLDDLNKCFSQYFYLDISDKYFSISTMEQRYAIPKFATMYENAKEAVNLIGETQGLKIGLNFGFIFGYSIFTSLAMYRLIRHFDYDEFKYASGIAMYNMLFISILMHCIWKSSNIKN